MKRSGLEPGRIAALVFDVDGTLYPQRPLRLSMLARLARAHLFHPARGLALARILYYYRRAQERLRSRSEPHPDLAGAQLDDAAAAAKLPRALVEECVARWIDREPLELIARLTPPALAGLLADARARGLKLGVFSDYPPRAKLDALGVGDRFDVVAWAQQPEIGALKPNPRGLRAVLAALDVAPGAALYVGDRADTDERAAAAAGMPCVLLTRGFDLAALRALMFP